MAHRRIKFAQAVVLLLTALLLVAYGLWARYDNARLAQLRTTGTTILPGENAKALGRRLAVTIGENDYSLELALDRDERYQGLSDRGKLASNSGMLFVFPKPTETSFVMRRCHIPLDIVFLSDDGEIVAMHRMKTQPIDTPEADLKRYPSGGPIRYAIELNAGHIDRNGLKIGGKIALPFDSLKRQAR